jgi:hypothetical protein
MKDLENIDDLFGSALENYKVAPPLDAKLAIEKELSKRSIKKNNRKKGGWLLLAITSISIMATAMFVQQKSTQTTTEKAINSTELFEKQNEKEHKNNVVTNSNIEIKSNNNEIKSAIEIALSKEQNLNENKTTAYNGNQKLNNSIKNKANKNQGSKQENYFTSYNKPSETAMNIASNVVLENIENNSSVNGSIEAQDKIESNIINSTKAIESKENEITQNDELAADSALSDLPPSNIAAEIISPQPKTKRAFISMHVGSGTSMNHFYKNNNIAKQELKDSVYFNKPYLSANLMGGMEFNQISVSSGLGFYQLYEKVAYSAIGQRKTQILVDSIYINPITLDTIVKHNVPVDTTLNYYTKNEVQNTYSILQIPILIGYKFVIGTNWELDLSSGGSFNLLINSKGNYKISPQGALAGDQSKTQKPYKNYSFSALAMVGLTYHIQEKMSLQMALPVQIGLNNFNKNEYFIRRSLYNIGLQLGLKYHF